MKKLLSFLLSLVLAIVLIPVSALPVYAASQLNYIGIKYNTKSVALPRRRYLKLWQDLSWIWILRVCIMIRTILFL